MSTLSTGLARPAPSKLLIVSALALLCVVWGTTWSVIQIGLRGIPPFSGVSIRFAIAALLLLALARIRGVPLGRQRRERMLWLINGLCSFLISYGVVYWAEQWVPSGLASVLFATYPLFVAIFSRVLLPHDRLTGRGMLAILISFGGVGLIFAEDFSVLGGPAVLLASVVMLLSPASAALGSVAVKRWGAGVHPYSITAVPMGLTALSMGAVALATERDRVFQWDGVSVGALLYLAVIGSAVTFTLYYWLLSHLSVQRLALITYVIPIVAVVIGVARGEPLTPRILLGSAIVVGGVALATHKR